ncbi:glycosyltransferase [Flammeovirga sp. SubArs3]|uniref:glycosyltransferase n=1 Tax=Flammeovirga sp. SubArs3 TaxID=2995316 RepID=UPI00248BAE28|nr:glycosyltransferase [Flammeovirga sp. SubArs3]
MKIAVISTSYHPYNIGGGEHSARQLVNGLKEKDIEVFVIAAYNKNTIEEVDGVRVYRVKSPNFYWGPVESPNKNHLEKLLWHTRESYNPTVGNSLNEILLNEKPDLLHIRNITNFSSYIWKFANEINIKSITTLNNYASICTKTTLFNNGHICSKQCLSCKILSYPKKITSRYADGVVGVSSFTLNEHLKRGYFKNSISTVIRTYLPLNESITTRIFNENSDVNFGFIGQIIETKGVINIIRAFKNAELSKNTKLYLAGGGDDKYIEECKKEAKGKSNIIFLGKVNSDEFYRMIDLVIISSMWYEPFPRVLIESYSYKKPVVSTTMGGTTEMIIEGETGFLYKNDESLEKILKSINSNPLQLNQMTRHIENYVNSNSKSDIDQYIDFYYKLLEK